MKLKNYLQLLNLRLQLTAFICGNRGGNDWPRNSTGPSKCLLGWDKDIGNILKHKKASVK